MSSIVNRPYAGPVLAFDRSRVGSTSGNQVVIGRGDGLGGFKWNQAGCRGVRFTMLYTAFEVVTQSSSGTPKAGVRVMKNGANPLIDTVMEVSFGLAFVGWVQGADKVPEIFTPDDFMVAEFFADPGGNYDLNDQSLVLVGDYI